MSGERRAIKLSYADIIHCFSLKHCLCTSDRSDTTAEAGLEPRARDTIHAQPDIEINQGYYSQVDGELGKWMNGQTIIKIIKIPPITLADKS